MTISVGGRVVSALAILSPSLVLRIISVAITTSDGRRIASTAIRLLKQTFIDGGPAGIIARNVCVSVVPSGTMRANADSELTPKTICGSGSNPPSRASG